MAFSRFELHHQEPPYEAWGVRRVDPRSGGATTHFFGNDLLTALEYFAELFCGPRCVECGDPPMGRFMPSVQAEMDRQGVCHMCFCWRENVASHSAQVAVVDGERYTIAPDQPPGYRGSIGHGGAEFRIRFHDGREVVTRNLWAQGVVPEHFRGRIPDNAVFVRIGGYAGYRGVGSAHYHDENAGDAPNPESLC